MIFMSGIVSMTKNLLADWFLFAFGVLHVRYIGLLIMTKRMSSADFFPLVEKI